MEILKLKEIAKAVGSRIDRDADVTNIVTDSRLAQAGSLFIAFRGDNVDGSRYIPMALEQGAVAAIAEGAGDYLADRVITVKSSLRALQDIAAHYRAKYPARVIAVTGSVGKTTTKDMIATAVEPFFRTIRTAGNQNNEIGAPKTVLNITKETELAVVEMGMSAFGEINDLCRVAKPEIGVVTNIGVAHIELLGSRENILRAKLELADNLPDGAPLLLCDDNDLLSKVEIPRLDIIRYGLHSPRCDIRGEIYESTPEITRFRIITPQGQWRASVPGTGEHLVLDALAAFGVARHLGIEPEAAIAALTNYSPSGMRQKIVPHKDITVVEDCYNASPDSMRAALSTLATYPCAGRRIFCAADMLELGSVSEEMHRQVGRFAAESGIDMLFCCGGQAKYIAEEARSCGLGKTYWYETRDELAQAILAAAAAGDIIWYKGSRGMALEKAIAVIYENY